MSLTMLPVRHDEQADKAIITFEIRDLTKWIVKEWSHSRFIEDIRAGVAKACVDELLDAHRARIADLLTPDVIAAAVREGFVQAIANQVKQWSANAKEEADQRPRR